jgi:hypothetical protein
MMKRIDRFRTLADFKAERQRAKDLRDLHAERFREHVNVLGNGKDRSRLLKNSISGLVHGLPGKILSVILGRGGIGSGLGLAVGAGKGGWAKRAALFAVGLAMPDLVKRLESLSLSDLAHELQVSWHRWKEHMAERREQRS